MVWEECESSGFEQGGKAVDFDSRGIVDENGFALGDCVK